MAPDLSPPATTDAPPEACDDLFPPEAVIAGRYRVVRRIARGGMGLVYEVEDTEIGGAIALKAVRPDVAIHPTNLARFRREIHLARRITHPNVCRLYDFGQHQDPERVIRFLTMELLHGETLAKRLERVGPLPTEEALPIVAQIVSGLAAAHEAGVIHRDFKPSNVILCDRGRPRAVITDFGLSLSIKDEGEDPSRLTASGQLMGTLAYIAPEQLEGQPCSTLSDLYSFGVVFYQMITGILPFRASTPLMTALMRLNEEPKPPSQIQNSVPADIEDAVLRCLRRDPRERFAEFGEVLNALGLEATRESTTTILRPAHLEQLRHKKPWWRRLSKRWQRLWR
jgi:eukaryotic-like serine/threonine-protein kinase